MFVYTYLAVYNNKPIHIYSFFDQFVAWYVMFYLENLIQKSGSYSESFMDLLNDLIQKGKIKVVPLGDNLTDYSRFQAASNERKL